MTAGCDVRPVTASGSVRISDVQHARNMRSTMVEGDHLNRRAQRTLVLEEIEDFEHKLGWKMRKNLGPRWDERRFMEEEEERTMGLKKSRPVRPPSPVYAYDYTVADHNAKFGPVTARSPNSLTVANNSPRWGASFYGSGGGDMFGGDRLGGAVSDWAPFDRPATGYESARNVFIVTRQSQRAATCMQKTMAASARPATDGGRPSTQSFGFSSTRQRIMTPMKGVQTYYAGKSGGSMELWTAHSMLEPIFMPVSATHRLASAQAAPLQSISQRLVATANSRRWEDGPGKHFWGVQEKNLRAAIRRTEGNKMRNAQIQGSDFQRQHDDMVEQHASKHDQAALDAKRRLEYFPRAKIFAESRMREQMKSAWEQREQSRLRMGMNRREITAEASVVADETANFDLRLAQMQSKRQATAPTLK